MGNLKKPCSQLSLGKHAGAGCGNGMTPLTKVVATGSTGSTPTGSASESAKTDDPARRAAEEEEDEDEPEGDRLSERVEKLLMDIKAGKVKTTVYTFDEHMRYLDSIRDK